ncbi:hypothetical protein X798_04525, partial [Onchocerca flexuosa]
FRKIERIEVFLSNEFLFASLLDQSDLSGAPKLLFAAKYIISTSEIIVWRADCRMAMPSTSAAGKLDRSLPNVDTINLRLILVSGKTKEFQLAPHFSALDVTQYVFDHWPDEWKDERVNSSSMLKLIYHGRFLHGSVTLGALSLPVGKTAVMHLVTRENLPESSTNGKQFKENKT